MLIRFNLSSVLFQGKEQLIKINEQLPMQTTGSFKRANCFYTQLVRLSQIKRVIDPILHEIVEIFSLTIKILAQFL